MQWIQSHWQGLVAVGSAFYVLLGAINGLLPHGGALQTTIGKLLDRLSPLARSDSPGTLKMPLTASKPPGSSDMKFPDEK